MWDYQIREADEPKFREAGFAEAWEEMHSQHGPYVWRKIRAMRERKNHQGRPCPTGTRPRVLYGSGDSCHDCESIYLDAVTLLVSRAAPARRGL